MKRIVYLFIIIVALFSCEKEKDVEIKPGYFILTELKSPHLKSAQADPIKNQFSLGNLKASKEYFFILSNGGESSIFDVQFSSDNPAFKVFPQKINELAGTKTASNLIPLVSLNVIHGTRLNGIGYSNLLPMGDNSATITISGKIIENGDSVKIESSYSFNVNAQVMDISIFKDDKEIDLTKPDASSSSNLGGLGFVRMYMVSTNKISIQNKGNVDIYLTNYSQDQFGTTTKSEVVPILTGQTIPFILTSEFSTIELESDGTIAPDDRIQLGNNGKGYFGFIYHKIDTVHSMVR